jgi:hypothetical protein
MVRAVASVTLAGWLLVSAAPASQAVVAPERGDPGGPGGPVVVGPPATPRPVPMPHVRPRVPGPVPMPHVVPAEPGPVPMPHLRFGDDEPGRLLVPMPVPPQAK